VVIVNLHSPVFHPLNMFAIKDEEQHFFCHSYSVESEGDIRWILTAFNTFSSLGRLQPCFPQQWCIWTLSPGGRAQCSFDHRAQASWGSGGAWQGARCHLVLELKH